MISIKQELDQMLKRCLTLHGTTTKEVEVEGKKETVIVPKDEAVRQFIKDLCSDSAADSKEMIAKIQAAWDDKTRALQKELSAQRVEAIGNFIASESTFKSAFFSTTTLGPSDEPVYTNETGNEVRIGSLGEDGKPEQVRVVNPSSRTNVALYLVASDIVRWKTLDLYRGDIS